MGCGRQEKGRGGRFGAESLRQFSRPIVCYGREKDESQPDCDTVNPSYLAFCDLPWAVRRGLIADWLRWTLKLFGAQRGEENEDGAGQSSGIELEDCQGRNDERSRPNLLIVQL